MPTTTSSFYRVVSKLTALLRRAVNMHLQHTGVVWILSRGYHVLTLFAAGAAGAVGAEGAVGATVAECLFPIARTFSYRLLVLMS